MLQKKKVLGNLKEIKKTISSQLPGNVIAVTLKGQNNIIVLYENLLLNMLPVGYLQCIHTRTDLFTAPALWGLISNLA